MAVLVLKSHPWAAASSVAHEQAMTAAIVGKVELASGESSGDKDDEGGAPFKSRRNSFSGEGGGDKVGEGGSSFRPRHSSFVGDCSGGGSC